MTLLADTGLRKATYSRERKPHTALFMLLSAPVAWTS